MGRWRQYAINATVVVALVAILLGYSVLLVLAATLLLATVLGVRIARDTARERLIRVAILALLVAIAFVVYDWERAIALAILCGICLAIGEVWSRVRPAAR